MSERRTPAIVIDACAMMPPEPMERTLDALERLSPGETLLLVIPRRPAPLFDMLADDGYSYRIETRDDGLFEISIWQDPAA